MTRRKLLAHLRRNGCSLLREGKKYSIYHNDAKGLSASVPRHRELDNDLCQEICDQLSIPRIGVRPEA